MHAVLRGLLDLEAVAGREEVAPDRRVHHAAAGGIDDAPQLNLASLHLDRRRLLAIEEKRRGSAGGRFLERQIGADLLKDENLLEIAIRREAIELSQIIVIRPFNDEHSRQSVEHVQGRGAVLVGVIPMRPRRLSRRVGASFRGILRQHEVIRECADEVLRPRAARDPVLVRFQQIGRQQLFLFIPVIGRQVAECGWDRLFEDLIKDLRPLRLRRSVLVGNDLHEDVVAEAVGAGVRPVKVEICRAGAVKAIRKLIGIGVDGDRISLGVDGEGLITIVSVIGVGEILLVHLIEEHDLHDVAHPRAKRRPGGEVARCRRGGKLELARIVGELPALEIAEMPLADVGNLRIAVAGDDHRPQLSVRGPYLVRLDERGAAGLRARERRGEKQCEDCCTSRGCKDSAD